LAIGYWLLADFMRKLIAFIEISRPINGLIAFVSVFLGAFLASGGISPLFELLYMAMAVVSILSAGNSINDYCDFEIDRINKPNRPLPSGRIKKKEAFFFSIILMGIGTILGSLVNVHALVLCAFAILTLFFYAVKLRSMPLWGNILVGVLTALTFIAGGIAVGELKGTLVAAAFAFFFTVSREIVKDIEDEEGDRKGKAATIPIKWGKKRASQLASLFVALGVLFSPIPYLIHLYSEIYLVLVLVGVDLVLIFCMLSLWRNISSQNAARIQQIMKLDIFVGLAAIYFGKL
jgi:geranylgeranylglycerol-phosphate geranylgeranyltransferase